MLSRRRSAPSPSSAVTASTPRQSGSGCRTTTSPQRRQAVRRPLREPWGASSSKSYGRPRGDVNAIVDGALYDAAAPVAPAGLARRPRGGRKRGGSIFVHSLAGAAQPNRSADDYGRRP